MAWTVVNRHVRDSLGHVAAGHNLAGPAAAGPGSPAAARIRTAKAASSSNDTGQKMSDEHAGPAEYSWAYDASAIGIPLPLFPCGRLG